MSTKVTCATDSKCCDNCIYSSTDGFYAPSLWCNKNEPRESRGGVSAGADDKKPFGTICEDYVNDHGMEHIRSSTNQVAREAILSLIETDES